MVWLFTSYYRDLSKRFDKMEHGLIPKFWDINKKSYRDKKRVTNDNNLVHND